MVYPRELLLDIKLVSPKFLPGTYFTPFSNVSTVDFEQGFFFDLAEAAIHIQPTFSCSKSSLETLEQTITNSSNLK